MAILYSTISEAHKHTKQALEAFDPFAYNSTYEELRAYRKLQEAERLLAGLMREVEKEAKR